MPECDEKLARWADDGWSDVSGGGLYIGHVPVGGDNRGLVRRRAVGGIVVWVRAIHGLDCH